MAGFWFQPADPFELGVDLVYTVGDASMDQIMISAPEWAAKYPNQSWDFTQTHTFSDLDLTRIDAELWGKMHFATKYWLRASYRYAEVEDDQPYITDSTGDASWYGLSVGREF
jgi:hypothetical protein